MSNTTRLIFDWERLKTKILNLKFEISLLETPVYLVMLILFIIFGALTILSLFLGVFLDDPFWILAILAFIIVIFVLIFITGMLENKNLYREKYYQDVEERKDKIKDMLILYLFGKNINDIEINKNCQSKEKTYDKISEEDIDFLYSKFENELEHVREKNRLRGAIVLWVLLITIIFKAVEYSAIVSVWVLGGVNLLSVSSDIVKFIAGWIVVVIFLIYYFIVRNSNGPINRTLYALQIRNLEYTLQALKEIKESMNNNSSMSSDDLEIENQISLLETNVKNLKDSFKHQKKTQKEIQEFKQEIKDELNNLSSTILSNSNQNLDITTKQIKKLDDVVSVLNSYLSEQQETNKLLREQNESLTKLNKAMEVKEKSTEQEH